MVGRLDRNLRQGHRAELEGIDSLRPFCAVASVPQTEDVGFDAVATLLRTDGRFFYAEDSFCVQFKARSVRKVAFSPHEYKWFHSLSMPLFIASVDTATKEVELFTTHWPAGHPNTPDFKSAIMHLDPGQNSLDDDCMQLWLGPPVLRWTPDEAEEPAFQALAYTVLKQWVTTEYSNLALRRIRTKRQLWEWKTNEVPGPGGMSAIANPDDLVRDLEAIVPYLMKIATHIIFRDTDASMPPESLGLYLLSNWLSEQKVPDTKVLVQMMEHKLGVCKEGFRLEFKVENTRTTGLDDLGGHGPQS